MAEKLEKYNHDQLIKWLEEKFKNKKIYKNLEESPEFQTDFKKAEIDQKFFTYPQLSIDLILVKERSETLDEGQIKDKEKKAKFNYYTLFFSVSSKKIFNESEQFNDFKKRLLFYQFYLSRVSEPKRFKIIVIAPYYISLTDENLDFFKQNGFGLWKINITAEDEDEKCQAKSLRERMIEEFKASVDNPKDLGEAVEEIFKKDLKNIDIFREAIKEKAEDFSIFFDQYILDSVDAVAGITPSKFGKRYIDRRLLTKILELKNVSYGKRLRNLVNEHLDENGDDYQFVSEVFSILWEENIGIPYSRFLETFEPVLLHIFAEHEENQRIYRDHYIHQFQVFLLGLYILDKFYSKFKTEKYNRPELNWLIAASFHDMAYPVQLYDSWSKKFFKDVFKVPVDLSHIDLKSNFVDQSFMSCLGYIICSLCSSYNGEKMEGNWLADKKELVKFFYEQITERKNHCVLSSISLLKILQATTFNDRNTIKSKISNNKDKFENIVKEVFVPSALSIAIHDDKIWQKLRKEKESKEEMQRILDCLEFQKCPITFLLIFCDNIQEWGRPSKSGVNEDGEMKFFLKDIIADSEKGIDITIWTPKYTKSEDFFINKQEEFRAIQFILRQPKDLQFMIHLEDKKNKVEDFTMSGPLA